MGIKDFFGPFDKKGNVINQTTVLCECDQCGYTWTARYKQAKNSHYTCRACAKFGAPVLPQDIFDEYSEIIEIHELSDRGGVTNDTVISAVCPSCGLVYDMPFRNIKKVYSKGRNWMCNPCAQVHRYNDVVVYPRELNNIISFDAETLGHLGQLKDQTVLTIACEDCGNEFDRYYKNYKTGNFSCNSCNMRSKWDDEDYIQRHREGMDNASQSHGGYVSSGHDLLKAMMEERGLFGFESEQWLGRYRVDEANHEAMVVIEYFGSYWHADPRKYEFNEVVYGNKTAGEIWEEDRVRIQNIQEMGYSVYVIWEKDFLNNPDSVIEELVKEILVLVSLGENE